MDLERLLSFQGYGNPRGPLWFLGFEEGLGQRDHEPDWSPQAELKARTGWAPVMDARMASETIKERYWERRDYSQVWKVMAKLALGVLHRAEDWNSPSRIHEYVVTALGRSDGETFLGEVMPLPAKGRRLWHFGGLYTGRDAYEENEWPRRLALWRSLLTEHRPAIVICYGRGNRDAQWDRYRAILGVPVVTLASKRSMTSEDDQPLAYLMPFFGNGQCRAGDIEEVIQHARSRTQARVKARPRTAATSSGGHP